MNRVVTTMQREQLSLRRLIPPILRRLCLWVCVCVCLAGTALTASGATFKRKGGDSITGEILHVSKDGIVFKTSDGRPTMRVPFAQLEENEIAGDAKVKAFRDAQAAKEKQQAAPSAAPRVQDLVMPGLAAPGLAAPSAPGKATPGGPAASKTVWKAKDGVPGEVETKYSFLDVRDDCKPLAGKTIKMRLWVSMGSSLTRKDGDPTPEYDGYYGSVRDGLKTAEEAEDSLSISSVGAYDYSIGSQPCIFFPKEAGRLMLEVFKSDSLYKLWVTFVMEKVTDKRGYVYYIMHVKQIDRL